MITIIIDTDGDAFYDDAETELDRILVDLGKAFRQGCVARTIGRALQDSNGNTVGRVHGDCGLAIDGTRVQGG